MNVWGGKRSVLLSVCMLLAAAWFSISQLKSCRA